MLKPYDPSLMETSLELARQAEAVGEVPVGALVFDPEAGEIVATAHNMPIAEHDPTGHAEIIALRKAGQAKGNYRLMGLELYVTLEPCTMCAAAISYARIGRVIYAAEDKKGGAVANGVQFFSAPTCHWSPEVICAETYAEEAGGLLKDFFANRRRGN